MGIFKKKKAYELENIAVVDNGKITGISPNMYICEKTNHTPQRKIKCPDNVTKIYINNH